MMRERISDDIYVFTSRRYAQVTCGAVLTKDGAILIDTLYYPDEAKAVQDFVERRLGHQVRYVINTHYHADHTTGTYLYPHAIVVGHLQCRALLDTIGREGLAKTRSQLSEFEEVSIVLPSLLLSKGWLELSLGRKIVQIMTLPGHSKDSLGVYVPDCGVLFASDAMMPVPTFFDGNYEEMISSLHQIQSLVPDTVVQGHGEVGLRGEIDHMVQSNIEYMVSMKDEVSQIIAEGLPRESLVQISIEHCGKSRVPLNGLVVDLHIANLYKMYDDLVARQANPVLNSHQS